MLAECLMTRWAWVWVSDDVHDGHTHTHSHHQYLSWRHTPAWCLLLHFFPLRLTRWKLWPTISPKMLNIAFLFAEVTLHMFGAFVNDLYVRCLNNSMHMLGLVCLSVLSVPLVWSLFVLLHFLSVSLVFCLFSVSSTCLFIPPPPPPFVWPNFFFQFSLSASIHSCARTRACPQLYLHCTSRLKKKLLLQRSYCEDLFNTWNRPNRPDIRGNIQGTSWVSLVGVSRQGVKGESTVSSKYSWNQ